MKRPPFLADSRQNQTVRDTACVCRLNLVEAIVWARAVDSLQVLLVDIVAVGERLARALDVDSLGVDVLAGRCGAAGKGGDVGGIAAVGGAPEVLEQDVRDCQRAWVVVAQRQVLLAVALVHLNGVLNLPRTVLANLTAI